MTTTTRVDLTHPVMAIHAVPGDEVVIRGSFLSTFDGSVVDAGATSFGAPPSPGVDAGGLIDFAAGGMHIVSRDAASHEAHALVTGEPAPACAALGQASPCLVLRLLPQARSRLMTVDAWSTSLHGSMAVEAPSPPPAAVAEVTRIGPYVGVAAALALAAVAAKVLHVRRRRWLASPKAQLIALAGRVRQKALRDPVVAAPLESVLDAAERAVRDASLDPDSPAGRRVRVALERLEGRLDGDERRERVSREDEAADGVIHQIEDALEAAEEARGVVSGRVGGRDHSVR